jgi:hypothetical protein
MAIFLGNSNDVMKWQDLLTILESTPPRLRGSEQDDDIHIGNPKVEKLIKIWERAGYNSNSAAARWIDFLPGEHFSNEWTEKFSNWLGYDYAGSWVSAVPPGYIVPWHPDYKMPEQEAEWLSRGKVEHFTCYICQPSFGQVSIIDNHAIYNATQGDVYRWDDWQDWHGGMNMGLTTKYIFNFFGWKK